MKTNKLSGRGKARPYLLVHLNCNSYEGGGEHFHWVKPADSRGCQHKTKLILIHKEQTISTHQERIDLVIFFAAPEQITTTRVTEH